MKAIDLINLNDGGRIGEILKLGPSRYSYRQSVLTFRELVNTLEEQGVKVCFL